MTGVGSGAMSRNILLTCAAIAAVVIVVTFFLTIPQKWSEELAVQPAEEQPKKTMDYEYELKSCDGKLAVYFYGETQPRRVFDVYVQTLPEWDREQLKTGVPVKDYEELLKRIEDYSS